MSKRRGPTPKRTWQPMAQATPTNPESFQRKEDEGATIWMNDRYTVIVNVEDPAVGMKGWVWLSIRRNDRKAARDWRDFQRIKNDICGEEREGVELYPAESRLMDTSNQFHVWVYPEGERPPVGFMGSRVVTDEQGRFTIDGQVVPDDLLRETWERQGIPPEEYGRAVQRPRDQEK